MKRKFRHIYTVIRNTEPQTLAEARQETLTIKDEVGEYLYGFGGKEKITVNLEMYDKDNERWMPVNIK